MPTLQEYRQATARLLGGYEGRGALAASGARRTTVGSTTAKLLEARWPILRTRLDADLYEAGFLLRTNPALAEPADRVRQIGPEGYLAQEGAFVPDTDWTNAPSAGEEYELHTHGFDPEQEMTGFINEALRAIMLVVDVGFVLASDEKGAYVPEFDEAGLSLAGWLRTPAQILSVRYGEFVGPIYAVNGDVWSWPVRGSSWVDGDRLYLTAFGGAQTAWVRALKPADWHCRAAAGAYGSQRGLRAGVDSDAAVPEVWWVAAGASALAWEHHPDTTDANEARLKALKIAEAKATFYGLQREYYAHAQPATTYVPQERLQ